MRSLLLCIARGSVGVAVRRHALTGCALMVGVGTLGACVSLAPEVERPALPVPAQYAGDGVAAEAGASAAMPAWRDYFTDPGLRDAIETALANNRDLRLAATRVDEARAAYGIQRSAQFPTLNVEAGAGRSRTPADLNLTGRPLIGSQYQVEVGLATWELDFWGRVRSLKDAALENYLASESAHRATRLALIAQVANTYLAQCELEQRLALAHKTLASRQESFRIFKRRVEVGSTSRLDLTQVEALLTQAESLSAQLEQARAANAHALALLVGAPVAVPATGETIEQGGFAALAPGLPSDLLAHRPDIMAAEHRLKAAQANIGAARAAFFPRIGLTAGYGSASAELSGLFDAGSSAWTVAPAMSLPIFDGGRNRANLDLAQVRRDGAVAEYEKAIQSAFRDVMDALSARTWLARQVEVARHALQTQTERARLAQLRYDNGATTYLEVLDAQRELLNAEQALVQVRRAYWSSNVSLYAALGGDTVADTAPDPAAARSESTPGR